MKKLMIVDDSSFVFEEMKGLLAGSEYEVAAYARNGEESISMYGEIAPDVVTMDIILPGMDGLEASKHILEKWPDAKIVVVSSLAYEDTISEAEGLGITEFIYKPFERESLLAALDKCFGGAEQKEDAEK